MRRVALRLTPLAGMPMVRAGDDIAALVLEAALLTGHDWADGDIVVTAQKIVSKAEGRIVRLDEATPSQRARELAAVTGKDPRLVELVLSESSDVLRAKPGVLVVEHRLGHIMANAGIDRSNLEAAVDDDDVALLLPIDPDDSASRLRAGLQTATGKRIGVIVSDSAGRAWRLGVLGLAIGTAGPPMVVDRRGDPDLAGRALQVTDVGFADAVAAAAVLAMGEGAEGAPAAVASGLCWPESGEVARDGLRPIGQDMFR